jgi:integrase
MPKKSTKEKVVGRYFTWLLFERDGVWYADGRSNRPAAGRHSLGTRGRSEALGAVRRLDVVRAVDLGLADRSELAPGQPAALTLEAGWDLYRRHADRARIAGGAKPKSVARYKAVFDKFLPFARREAVAAWGGVTTRVLEGYAAWLDGEGYAYRTEYLELTTLKQCANWLRKAGHLPAGPAIELSLRKPTGTDTYCWRPEEVAAIVAHCRATPDLHWLGDVATALASTGLRISELAGLRTTDVGPAANVIRLTDETTVAPAKAGDSRRLTKNSRGRSLPISAELREVLGRLPASPDGLLFHGPRGGRLKPDTARGVLVRSVLAPLAGRFPSPQSGPGFADGRLHSFRHYFCSQCATSGVPELAVMDWLGHQSSGMVRHYFHLHDRQAQEQMARVTFVPGAGGVVPPAGSGVGRGPGRKGRSGGS